MPFIIIKDKKEEGKKEISMKQGWGGYSKTVFWVFFYIVNVGRTVFLTVNFRLPPNRCENVREEAEKIFSV